MLEGEGGEEEGCWKVGEKGEAREGSRMILQLVLFGCTDSQRNGRGGSGCRAKWGNFKFNSSTRSTCSLFNLLYYYFFFFCGFSRGYESKRRDEQTVKKFHRHQQQSSDRKSTRIMLYRWAVLLRDDKHTVEIPSILVRARDRTS